MIFNDIGIQVPRVLIPRPDTDLNLWAVIACDQYTSQPDYWKKVRKLVGNSPSTLHLIMPEIDLDAPELDALRKSAAIVEENCNNLASLLA